MVSRRSSADIVAALGARDRSTTYPCEGLWVGRLWLDQGFALELHPSQPPATDGALLRLYLSFLADIGDGMRTYEAHDHKSLLPLFSLLGTQVRSAVMTANAEFRLELEGGAILSAGSLDERDFWEFQQPWRPAFGH